MCKLLLILLFATISAVSFSENKATEVFVLGTIHGEHESNPSYTYRDVIRIIATYNPDVLCVEIRPKDFRKVANLYPSEMIMATVYGIENKIEVVPIDWFLDSAVKEKRNLPAFWKTEEGKSKAEKFELLKSNSKIVVKFESEWRAMFGSDRSRQQPKIEPDFLFYNSKALQEYRKEWNTLSEQVFGDSPVNSWYRERNQKMLALIEEATVRNPGKKIMVITGTDHKHYFDEGLKSNPQVIVFAIEKIPLFKDIAFPEAFRNYAEHGVVPAIYFQSTANMAVNQVP